MKEVKKSFCRICLNGCALIVHTDSGRVVKVSGDPDNPLFKGYSCIKGRSQPDYLYHPERNLYSRKRIPGGEFKRIGVETAMDEVAERLAAIKQESGPGSIVSYAGTMLWGSYTSSMPMLHALMDTIDSPLRFDTDTLDKGGKLVAAGLHGEWMAPACGFDEPEVMLLIGINPVLTFTGIPTGNPGQWLKEKIRGGMKLIVIDPRRTAVAKRAHLHLRPKPGTDVDILACFLRTILNEGLYDRKFSDENINGIEQLVKQVAPFTPDLVAHRTGLDADDLVQAARMLAGKKRGYIMAGTGPHMAAQGTLTEYLVLAIQSLCGYWLRAGDDVKAVPSLLPAPEYKAQARSSQSDWAFGDAMGRNGHRRTRAGLPITALPDMMLEKGPNRVRAMICVGGNPAMVIPDYQKTVSALQSLDLLVQVDPWMTRTSQLAHYVVAPTMPLEAPATTKALDFLGGWTGYGMGKAYAQYTPAIVPPPEGSDVIDDCQFLLGLAKRLGNDDTLDIKGSTTDEIISTMTRDSRIPLDTIKARNEGDFYVDPKVHVQPRDDGWQEKLDVGNAEMMADLAIHARHGPASEQTDPHYPLRLLCRRDMHVYNSSCNVAATHRGKPYNPAYINPKDMDAIGVQSGELVGICSAHGAVDAVAEGDPDVPEGCLSIMFAYGADNEEDTRTYGTNPNALMSCDALFDRYTGQPRMSNLPVSVSSKKSNV